MNGPAEAALARLARSAPYPAGDDYRRKAVVWEGAAAGLVRSAADVGMGGLTAVAASAALLRRADGSRSLAAAAAAVPPLLAAAEAIRLEAQSAFDALPSAQVPAHALATANALGLSALVAAAYEIRRESAAALAVSRATTGFAGLTPKLMQAGVGLHASSMQAAGGSSESTADGAFHIGPPRQPTYDWDEDFVYDSEEATFDDFVSSEKWKTKLLGARMLRGDLSDATTAYGHYWDNNGEPWNFDYEKAYRDDEAIRGSIDSQIERARAAADELASSGRRSFSFTGDPGPMSGYPVTENWQKAIGGHQQWSSGDVTVENGRVTMTVTVHGDDHYNFNRGQADIASGSSDDENGRFTEIGWAKPFDSHGTVTRTVTWQLGDPGSVSVSPPSEAR